MKKNAEMDMLQSILTLRYDTNSAPKLSKLSWSDFQERKIDCPDTQLEEMLIQTIRSKTRGKKKISVALSGGIDSVLLTAIIKKNFPDIDIESISVRFPNSPDETKTATKISEKLETNYHLITIQNYLRELPKAISIIKRPFWDIHWYYVFKTSKNFSKLLLTGEGGDELFGGYVFRYSKYLEQFDHRFDAKKRVWLYLNCHERDWIPDQKEIFHKPKFDWNEIHAYLLPYFNNSLNPLNQIFLADFNGKLIHNTLLLNSHFKKEFNIDYITPFLSKKIINMASHLPINLKYDTRRKIGKLVLRKILSKYGLQKYSLKKKRGFSINTVNLWKTDGYEIAEHYLSDARLIRDGIINKDWVLKNLPKTKTEPNVRYINKFLGLLAGEIWYRMFVTKEITGNLKL